VFEAGQRCTGRNKVGVNVDNRLVTAERPSNALSGSVSGSIVQAGYIHGGIHFHAEPERLPYRFGVMPRLAGAFQGRADLRVVNTSEAADGVYTTVLTGLGGAGKTQAAVAEAERTWNNQEVELLAWINATSRDAIKKAYVALGADLTGTADADPDAGVQRLLNWLATTRAPWLVVLDDLQNPADLRGLWPPAGPSGRVLVTTRRRDAALSGRRRRLVEVGLFTAEEGVSYLSARLAETPELLDGAEELVRDLRFCPVLNRAV
jgi:NB-ARC domain-containing protein